MKKLIDVYPYKIEGERVYFLIFKRSSGKIYAEQWRMIGGKVKSSETRWNAALRELKEETGITPELFWTVPSINQFYEHSTDTVHSIPAFAAEIRTGSSINLDDEHTGFKWISSDEVNEYIHWPEQCRIIRLINELLIETPNGILPEWIIEL